MTAAVLAVLMTGAASALAETVHDGRTWFNLTAQGPIGASRWRWYFDVQERNRHTGEDADQFVARPGLIYTLNKTSSVWAGYAYTANFMPTGGTLQENRLWEQYLWSGPARGGTLSARSRLEQRWFKGTEDVGWRIRQQVRFLRPLAAKTWLAPIVWDELMFHLNSTSRSAHGFDQNRAFAGAGFTVSPKARIEVGYMNQFSHSRSVDRMNHILSTVVNLNF